MITALLPMMLALSTGSAPVQEAAPAEPYQVIRLGDGQMTCEVLLAEISDLSAEIQRVQQGITARSLAMMEQGNQLGGGAASAARSLGGMAAGLIPGADMLLGAASAAAAEAQMQAARRQMTEEVQAMANDGMAITPLSLRHDHLAELFRRKSC